MTRKAAAQPPKAAEKPNNTDTYTHLASGIRRLNERYGDLPFDSVFTAFMGAGGNVWSRVFSNMPSIQNARVKAINTLPAEFDKDKLAEMVTSPGENEQALRSVSASLASSTKTYDLILQTYQDMMSYDWYIYPKYGKNAEKDAVMREYALACKVAETIRPREEAHKAVGLCMEYGKVFYIPRISVDKAHNKVNYAFLQQLPTDYCKIVGYNNAPGRYTIAFNLLYFTRPGNTWEQFGNTFRPYMDAFSEVVEVNRDDRYAYCSTSINADKFKQLAIEKTAGNPEWQYAGGKWYYWVTLPADAVITFEINDRNPYVVPPTTGLMVSMTQIPNYEAAQMEIVLSPLTSVLTGELETFDPKGSMNEDPIRVSPSVRELFESFWYQMLDKNNTAGIGLFLAPAKNMKLQTLSDTVANTDIASTAFNDQITKAGLPALIPTTNDPKVGVAELSAMLHANVARPIYWAFERMMEWVFESLGFKTEFGFRMFGDVFSRDKELESARTGMTLGIMSDTLKYDAMNGHSVLDDLAISDFVEKSGILDKRKPIESTYGAKKEAGRPAEEGSENSQKTAEEKF